MSDDFKLCYINGSTAYFTTLSLDDQWGDDWDDAPYEHNAGTPYSPCWHNYPASRNNPNAKRGLNPETKEPLKVGELCRCSSCVEDWNEDGTPRYEIRKVMFETEMETPAEVAELSSRYSVQDINSGFTPWLVSPAWSDKRICVRAGVSIDEFTRLIEQSGGEIYFPRKATK